MIKVFWSEEDEAFIALDTDYDGLSAFGDTVCEAIDELNIARQGFIKVMKEDGLL